MGQARLGLVGVGWFGGVVAESARSSGIAEVVACFARSSDAREAFAREHGCRAVDTLDALLGDPEIEGVLLATPHSTHADLIEQVASAGKHVFVEKPLTLTVADAKRAIAATEKATVVLQVGHNRRRQPANRRIKRMIDAGELGTILQLEGNQSGPGGFSPALAMWRRDPLECPAGAMPALGVHIVDTFNSWVGPARRVTAFSKRLLGHLAIDDATALLIEYESGPLGSIGSSYFTAAVNTLTVYGTDGIACNEQDGARLLVQRRGEPARTEQDVETADTVVEEIAEFARCIRTGERPETGAAEGLEVVAVLEGLVESVASGRAVELSELH